MLIIPEITTDMSTLDAGYAYTKAGFYIGPGKRGSKHPGSVLGKDWQHKTSRDPQVITSWFAGTDHGVFLHAGRSGAVIFDVDHPENLPQVIRQAIRDHWPPYQMTRLDQPGRGHYVFAIPEGRRFGNSIGNLGNGWGEIRGSNGVIIAAPSQHSNPDGIYEWERIGPVPVLPGDLATQLPDAIDASEVATDTEVAAFLAKYRRADRPELLDIQIQAWQKKTAAGASRHSTVIGHITGAMKEARAGLVDAQLAADTFEAIFLPAVMREPIGPKQSKARGLAEARDEWRGILAWAVAQATASDPAETIARVAAEVPPAITEVAEIEASPKALTNGTAPPPGWEEDFWITRPVLTHLRDFARARRVGPWALLGCVLVRVVAATTTKIVIPALTGGEAPLNLYVGIVAFTGGGKGTAEKAARGAIDLPHVDVVGPGSGEGIGHLFKYWDNKEKTYVQYRNAVILSATEVSTLNAMKARQASTLFAELNKAWIGEPLGFSYVAKEKSLNIRPNEYPLCLITGVQPTNANVILDDVDSGSPARYLWMPASDPGRPIVQPNQPPIWRGWTLANSVSNIDSIDPTQLRPMDVCQTARDAVDQAALDRLAEVPTDPFNSHALLSRLKTAAALALLENRSDAITEEDWQLAGVVHAISDRTRLRIVDVVKARQRTANAARALEEGHREVVRGQFVEDHEVKQACQAITKKLRRECGSVTGKVARDAVPPKLRPRFAEAVEKLTEAGQIEVEATGGSRKGIRIQLLEAAK
jgi:Bifunctional DNA primase/polymerase, N-terminal